MWIVDVSGTQRTTMRSHSCNNRPNLVDLRHQNHPKPGNKNLKTNFKLSSTTSQIYFHWGLVAIFFRGVLTLPRFRCRCPVGFGCPDRLSRCLWEVPQAAGRLSARLGPNWWFQLFPRCLGSFCFNLGIFGMIIPTWVSRNLTAMQCI